MPLAQTVGGGGFFGPHTMWIVAGIIVVLGLLVFGIRDLLRLSWKRIWAISGVCFAESIRKKVLWVTALAIVGVIAISQLQRAVDEQDAIRQTLKISLFATGLCVVVTSIILACTNLPKEIENRVIFTIVTKPTTRLEVVLGKIIGFSRVAAAILLIMGLFTWGYAQTRAWRMNAYIQDRLTVPSLSATERATLENYSNSGLLDARTYAQPAFLNILSRPPESGDPRRYFYGGDDTDLMIPFAINRDALFPNGPDSGIAQTGLLICVKVGWSRYGPPEAPPTGKGDFALTPETARVPFVNAATAIGSNGPPPIMGVSLCDSQEFVMLGANDLQEVRAGASAAKDASAITLSPDGSPAEVRVWLPPAHAADLYKRSQFFVQCTISSVNVEGYVDPNPAYLLAPDASGSFANPTPIGPITDRSGRAVLLFHGRSARSGESLRGGDVHTPVAVFSFRNVPMPEAIGGQIHFEMYSTVEHSDERVSENQDNPTAYRIVLHDRATGAEHEVSAVGDNRQTVFFTMPAGALTSGNFDVLLWNKTAGDTLGLFDNSVRLVVSRENFALNLLKSLSIFWMMAVLVIAIAVFSSTFLSWPIAIVLTIVVLLGHWGVDSLSDDSGSALGRQVVQDMFGAQTDAAKAKMISQTVTGLSDALTTVSAVLPDISQFDAIDAIQRGVSIDLQTLRSAADVTLTFGLPLSVLAYLILRNKEVAP